MRPHRRVTQSTRLSGAWATRLRAVNVERMRGQEGSDRLMMEEEAREVGTLRTA